MSRTHLLVVEDDLGMADVLRMGFEQERYSVTVAPDGAMGLELAQEHGFGAIVLDVLLPVMDGYSVAQELRKSGNRTPILMLTARDAVSDIVRGFDCGVEDYLTKPFSFLELSVRVRALLRRNEPPVNFLEHSDLRIDLSSHQVVRGNREVHLTKTEFLVLETLMRHAGYVVRRQDLLRDIWGNVPGTASNSLDVAMSSLRAKIDIAPASRLIQTVRGFGYKLQGPKA